MIDTTLYHATHGTGNGWMTMDASCDDPAARDYCQHSGCDTLNEFWMSGEKLFECADCGEKFCCRHIGDWDLCRECGLKCFLNGGMQE
jgi:hypothetical protein